MINDSGKMFVTGHVVALMLIVVMMEKVFGHGAVENGMIIRKRIYAKGEMSIDEKIELQLSQLKEGQKKKLEIIIDQPDDIRLTMDKVDEENALFEAKKMYDSNEGNITGRSMESDGHG